MFFDDINETVDVGNASKQNTPYHECEQDSQDERHVGSGRLGKEQISCDVEAGQQRSDNRSNDDKQNGAGEFNVGHHLLGERALAAVQVFGNLANQIGVE
mmetsp:Transcript_16470/g.23913  ORF Transcript_16470/g.23913 Transcript_16470/m.23913 type:complete len:100 (+) Transcript_16470:192-491(+)